MTKKQHAQAEQDLVVVEAFNALVIRQHNRHLLTEGDFIDALQTVVTVRAEVYRLLPEDL